MLFLPTTSPSLFLTLLTHLLLLVQVQSLVTLETIRNLTDVTNDCRGRIKAVGESGVIDPTVVVLGGHGSGQVVLGGGEEGEEVEETVAAALRVLCSDLLVELEKPLLDSFPQSQEFDTAACLVVKKEFHDFLAATVKFLHEVQERQMLWQWTGESAVFDGIAWLQGLWASRTSNVQERSFIEQQMSLYRKTGCFGKSQEVLRRDVEVVEYLNDLMDSFR